MKTQREVRRIHAAGSIACWAWNSAADDGDLRRHHPRRRPQRADPAGLSRQGRAEDAGDRAQGRSPAAALRRWKTRAIRAFCTTRTRSSSARSPTMPWYADLELERHGARYIEPELNVALLTSDGGALDWWTDIERTVDVVRSSSAARDAETLRRWHHEFVPIVQNILAPESRSRRRCRRTSAAACSSAAPPAAGCSKSARCRRSNSCSRSSSIRPCRRACCSSTACARSICGCAASAITSRRCWRARPRRRCRAAAPRRWRARWKPRCARAAARFALMTEPKRIVVEDGRAVGVETADGEFIRARHFVASSLNPHQTFLDLLDEALRAARDPRPGRTASNTICWRRCSRCISICASRRATPRAPNIPSWRRPSW